MYKRQLVHCESSTTIQKLVIEMIFMPSWRGGSISRLGSCKTWMLDGWTIFAKNLDDSAKTDAFSGLFFELNGLHSVKPGLEKPGLANHGRHFGRPLQRMVA